MIHSRRLTKPKNVCVPLGVPFIPKISFYVFGNQIYKNSTPQKWAFDFSETCHFFDSKENGMARKKDLTKKTLQDLSVDELIAILESHIFTQKTESDDNYIYNDKGLMDFLRCSRSTLYRRKKSGILDPAITRLGGNSYKADKAKILSLLKAEKDKKKNNEKK